MNESHSDAEIVGSLASRGIEPAKASRLVDDLRHARPPEVKLPYALEMTSRHAPHPSAPPPPPLPHRHSHRRHHRRGVMPWWFVLLALIFLAALGYAVFEVGRGVAARDHHEIPPPPGQ